MLNDPAQDKQKRPRERDPRGLIYSRSMLGCEIGMLEVNQQASFVKISQASIGSRNRGRLMKRPWMPLYIADYLADTAHLNTSEHGAYLLLIMFYWTKGSLPESEEAIRRITRMTSRQWSQSRDAIRSLFGDGWRHTRIDNELAKAIEKSSVNSATAKRMHSDRRANAQRPPTHARASSHSPSESLSLCASVSEGEVESGDNPAPEAGFNDHAQWFDGDPAAVDNDPEQPELTPIDRGFTPPETVKAEALAFMDESTFSLEVQKFIFHHLEQGSISADWTASFEKWIARFKEFARDKPARPRGKPRIELNPDAPLEDKPKVNWDWHLGRWLKSESTWRRQTAGPEPGQPGCTVPPEMFAKWGIDPATGRKKQEETT